MLSLDTDRLISPADQADHGFYLLESGSVGLFAKGGTRVEIDDRRPDRCFGTMTSHPTGKQGGWQAETLTPAQILRIKEDKLRQLDDEAPLFKYAIELTEK